MRNQASAAEQQNGRLPTPASSRRSPVIRAKRGAIDQDSAASLPLPGALADALSNLLFLGNPFGARRPASARLPRQSASSLSDNVKTRPAESVQVRPFSTSNVLMSER